MSNFQKTENIMSKIDGYLNETVGGENIVSTAAKKLKNFTKDQLQNKLKHLDPDAFEDAWDSLVDGEYIVLVRGEKYRWED